MFDANEKALALFTAVTALARTLERSGALDRSIWIAELASAQNWLKEHGETGALEAYNAMMEMLTDI